MDYYLVVIIDDKIVFDIGKEYEARYILLDLIKIYKDKTICFFGDETYSFLEDKYKYTINNEDYGKPWATEYEYFYMEYSKVIPKEGEKPLSINKFQEIVDLYAGKEIKCLYDKIKELI